MNQTKSYTPSFSFIIKLTVLLLKINTVTEVTGPWFVRDLNREVTILPLGFHRLRNVV